MLNYKKTGSGDKTIFFIHGNSLSFKSWEETLESKKLNTKYRLVGVDLPGNGESFRSKNPKEEYTLEAMGKTFAKFVKEFGAKQFIVVTNSLGANVAGEAAPYLTDCNGFFLTGPCALGMGLTTAEVIQPNPAVAAAFMPHPDDAQLEMLVNDAGEGLSNAKKDLVRKDFRRADPAFRSSLAESVGNQRYNDELENLTKTGLPIAVVFGEHDKICFTNYFDTITFKRWKNKTILIPNSGHCCQMDKPEEVNKLIVEFAAECL